jgi:2-amino-4-hydroxy-6-hydroxymethyldihydropteridine diphosphokinase
MIIIGLGSNLPGPWGPPRETVTRALAELDRGTTKVVRVSRLLQTSPFGKSNQPPFVNAVAQIETHLPPEALMRRLHMIETMAGRKRGVRWGPRTLDLDLIDYRGLQRVQTYPQQSSRRLLWLPHPGIAERIFVLAPLAEIAPRWRHPKSKRSAAELLKRLQGHRGGAEI